MNKFIVKDWAGNVMDWGEFTSIEYAHESISLHVLDEMNSDGYDIVWPEDGGQFDEEVFYGYCSEYNIVEK